MKRQWCVAVIGLLLLLAVKASAQASSPVQEKDWQLQKTTDTLLKVSSCVASTTVAQSEIPLKVELVFPENEDKGAVILLRTQGLQGQVQKAFIRPDSKSFYTLALLSSDAATGEDVFLLSALQIPEALQVINAKSTLDIYLGEGSTAKLARISLRGSSVTLKRTADCRASKKLLNDQLMSVLRTDAASAAAVAGGSSDFLTSYETTLEMLNEQLKAQQSLNVELQKQAQLSVQVQRAQTAVSKAAQAEAAAVQNSAALRKKISDIQQTVDWSNQNLPALQAQRPARAAAVTQAANTVSSVEAQMQQLHGQIDQAVYQQQLRQRDVSQAQSQLSQTQGQVERLQQQASELNQQQAQQQNWIYQLQSQADDLSRRISNFNSAAEAERILNSDSSYRQAQRDLASWQQIQQASPGQIADAQARLQKAHEILSQCQAQKPTPPATKPDCKGPENRLRMVESEVRQREAQAAQARSEIPRLQGLLANMVRDARHRADQERNDMIAQRDDLVRQQRQAQSQIMQLQQQVDQIQRYSIPQSQQAVSQSQWALNQAQANLDAAATQVSNAEARLIQYRSSVGYDSLVAQWKEAKAQLQQLDQEIADAQDWIRNGPARLEKAQQDLARSDANIETQHQARLQADQVLAQAQAVLAAEQPAVDRAQAIVTQAASALETSRRATQGLAKTVF